MSYFEKIAKEFDLKWPYEVDYDKHTVVTCDVLVVGGGLSGSFAAIQAAKNGAKVVVIDKGNIRRSGAAGTGIDHWGGVFTNPCSTMTPEESITESDKHVSHRTLHTSYISMKEGYDAALDLEEYGVDIRDSKDEFAGSPLRDEETKHLFAYDYKNKNCMRIHGRDLKPALHKEMKRLGVQMFDRVMGTALLTEGGKQGGAVVGATGFHLRSGEFYTFHAKATIMTTAKPLRLWEFATELIGSNAAHDDPNCAGDGDVMAYRAGAKLMMMENSHATSGARRYPAYGTGNPHNTWYPCSIVDATGKQVPWVNRDGVVLERPEQRNECAPGQDRFNTGPGGSNYETQGPAPIPDLGERIKKGEYKLPFYADLGDLPDYERRALFGLMIGNEGKTYIPVYKNLTNAGFDPKKDMLQANVLPLELAGTFQPWWDVKSPGLSGTNVRETSFMSYGGIVVDWDMMSSLDGLFAAGCQLAGGEGATYAASTGRYCGRSAANYVKGKDLIPYDAAQVEAERQRVYAPVSQEGRFGWKEIQLGLCRMMQDYCGASKGKEILETGLWWMNSIRNHEMTHVKANNPHDLGKIMDCDVRLSVGEIIMHQSLMREESSREFDFHRIDFPEQGNNDEKFITIQLKDNVPSRGEMPFKYWLKGDYEQDYLENYKIHANLKEGE